MQIGICTQPDTLASQPLFEAVDFIEGHVQQFLLPDAPEDAFARQLAALRSCGKRMPACNSVVPPDLKLTGPAIDERRISGWVETVLRRAAAAGIRWIVVGSGAARSAPEGYPPDAAFEQYVQLLRRYAPGAEKWGLTLLVEPLQRGECNFLNTICEGAEAVRRVGSPSVQLLVDIFHMLRNGEDPDDIRKVAPLVRHVHLAENQDRAAPGVHNEDFRPFFRALRDIGYDELLTIEAVWTDLPAQLPLALTTLRRQLRESGY